MAKLVIFGAGDIARLAHHYFTTDSPHEVAGFVVDRAFRTADEFLGLPLSDAEDVTASGIRRPSTRCSWRSATRRMNGLRAEKYASDEGGGVSPGQLRQLALQLSGADARRATTASSSKTTPCSRS